MKYDVVYKPNPSGKTTIRQKVEAASVEDACDHVGRYNPSCLILAVFSPAELAVSSADHNIVAGLLAHLEVAAIAGGWRSL
jgi:hypothetical protein